MSGELISTTEWLNLTKTYLRQRSELYGSEFYSDVERSLSPSPTEKRTLETFYDQIKDCQKCELAKGRTRFVFGTGRRDAQLMCIGEAPGYEEDRAGEPFVGAAGQLLNKILASVGFTREEVYIANIVKCRPPGNRDPEVHEISECMPYLREQIDTIRPKLILALGRVAAQSLLGTEASLGSLRDREHHFENIKVLVTYHPAALLRNPQWKRSAWEDIQGLRRMYDQVVGDKPPMEFNKKQ